MKYFLSAALKSDPRERQKHALVQYKNEICIRKARSVFESLTDSEQSQFRFKNKDILEQIK